MFNLDDTHTDWYWEIKDNNLVLQCSHGGHKNLEMLSESEKNNLLEVLNRNNIIQNILYNLEPIEKECKTGEKENFYLLSQKEKDYLTSVINGKEIEDKTSYVCPRCGKSEYHILCQEEIDNLFNTFSTTNKE